MIRTNFSSGYPFEDVYGYARAVRVGDQIFVSGTTARAHHLDGDAYKQMMAAIATVAAALGEAGAELRCIDAAEDLFGAPFGSPREKRLDAVEKP